MNYIMNQQDKKAMLQALYTTQADFEERVDRWNICIEELQEIIDKLESDLNMSFIKNIRESV